MSAPPSCGVRLPRISVHWNMRGKLVVVAVHFGLSRRCWTPRLYICAFSGVMVGLMLVLFTVSMDSRNVGIYLICSTASLRLLALCIIA